MPDRVQHRNGSIYTEPTRKKINYEVGMKKMPKERTCVCFFASVGLPGVLIDQKNGVNVEMTDYTSFILQRLVDVPNFY